METKFTTPIQLHAIKFNKRKNINWKSELLIEGQRVLKKKSKIVLKFRFIVAALKIQDIFLKIISNT